MTLVQTKPNVTFLLLQQNFQLKFSFKSYFFFNVLLPGWSPQPLLFPNLLLMKQKRAPCYRWWRNDFKDGTKSDLRWLTVLHSRWRPAAFPATGACTLRKWELYTIMLEEWHQNVMYSNGIRFSSAFLKTLHCIKHKIFTNARKKSIWKTLVQI